jgi:L-lactate dehydrogenase
MWTWPRPAPAPLPDLINRVTALVMRKVANIARNIHIMGPSVGAPTPTETFTPDTSEETEEAASIRTTSPCDDRLVLGVYAAGCPGQRDPGSAGAGRARPRRHDAELRHPGDFAGKTGHTRGMDGARSTVSVVGAGHVGSAVANALVLLRVCDRVVLYDRDPALAEGEAWDIADTVPLLSEVEVTAAAGYADLGGSDVVVITAGVTLGPGQTRLDLLTANANTIVGIVGELHRACPGAVVILVTNPVDVLTRIGVEASARPAHLILGCGTVLDGARLQQRLGQLLDVERESVHAYVVGEHGDSSFPVWSSATVGAIGLEQFGLPGGRSWPQVKDELAAATRRRGMSIHERKGFTSYGVAAAVARIVRDHPRRKADLHGLGAGRQGVRDRAGGARPALRDRSRRSRPPAAAADVRRRASDAPPFGGNPGPGIPVARRGPAGMRNRPDPLAGTGGTWRPQRQPRNVITSRATTPMGRSFLIVASSTPAPSAAAIDAAASRRSSRRPLVTSPASRRSMSGQPTVRRATRSGSPSAARTPRTSAGLRTK